MSSHIPNEPVLYKNVITEEERMDLANYASDLYHAGKLIINGYSKLRHCSNCFYDINNLTPLHKNLYYKVVDRLKLDNPIIDPNLGMLISYILPGGFIHRHKDPYVGKLNPPRLKKFAHLINKRNVRFNVMVERGKDVSYNPRIENKLFEVNQCDAWCFAASDLVHDSLPISGPENRIVYQFGFMMDAI